MSEDSYKQTTDTFENFKKRASSSWHFDPSINSKDFEYLGRLKTNFEPILELMNDDKNFKLIKIVDENVDHPDLTERINEFKKWGFTEHNTKSLQMKDEDFPEIFKPFKEFSKLEHCTVVALKQYPGQCLPWHIDTLVGIRKKFNIPEDVNVIRYSLVLEDWKWGHYYLAGNSIFHQWKQGDIIQMPPNMYHTTCNSGITPKLSMTITGVPTDKSKNLIKSKKFEYIN